MIGVTVSAVLQVVVQPPMTAMPSPVPWCVSSVTPSSVVHSFQLTIMRLSTNSQRIPESLSVIWYVAVLNMIVTSSFFEFSDFNEVKVYKFNEAKNVMPPLQHRSWRHKNVAASFLKIIQTYKH